MLGSLTAWLPWFYLVIPWDILGENLHSQANQSFLFLFIIIIF